MYQAAWTHKDKHILVIPLKRRGQIGTQIAMIMVGVIYSKEGTLGA